jgi:hypothetical protein
MYHYFVCLPFFTYWWLIAGLHSRSKKDSGWYVYKKSITATKMCTVYNLVVHCRCAVGHVNLKSQTSLTQAGGDNKKNGVGHRDQRNGWNLKEATHIISDIHESNIKYVAEMMFTLRPSCSLSHWFFGAWFLGWPSDHFPNAAEGTGFAASSAWRRQVHCVTLLG